VIIIFIDQGQLNRSDIKDEDRQPIILYSTKYKVRKRIRGPFKTSKGVSVKFDPQGKSVGEDSVRVWVELHDDFYEELFRPEEYRGRGRPVKENTLPRNVKRRDYFRERARQKRATSE
jgi:hypothetical protein